MLQYAIIRILGEGSCGKIFEVNQTSTTIVALKKIKREKKGKDQESVILVELGCMKRECDRLIRYWNLNSELIWT